MFRSRRRRPREKENGPCTLARATLFNALKFICLITFVFDQKRSFTTVSAAISNDSELLRLTRWELYQTHAVCIVILRFLPSAASARTRSVLSMPQDRSNIRSFYLRQREVLVRFLTQRTRDPALAEDLAQETWIRVSQVGGVTAIENPQAYLFRIASNLVTDHSRAVARRRLTWGEIDEILQIPEDEPDPEKIAIDRSELQRVLGLLQDLPERQRQILLMSRLERLPHHAIARQFGISTRTVEFELTRALTACRPNPKK